MKTLTLALGALVALIYSSVAMAHPTAAASVSCEGRYAVATFSYTSNANGMTAHESLFIDGTQVAARDLSFGTAGATDHLSGVLPRDDGSHTVTAQTVVNDSNPGTVEPRAQASDSVTCRGNPPPPCQVNPDAPECQPPPPYCERHPNADRCKDNPPPPVCTNCTPPPPHGDCDVNDPNDPDCLPHTGPVSAAYNQSNSLPLWPFGLASVALLGAAGWLLRKQKDRS